MSEHGFSLRYLTRLELARTANRQGVPLQVVEKDYALSHLLAGIADVPELRSLCFKGGTALKKVYFGDYRFSEDLDFSAIDGPQGKQLNVAMERACQSAKSRLLERGRYLLNNSGYLLNRPW